MRHAIIKTASALPATQKALLKQRFETLLKEKITVSFEEDPSLIGGFAAYIDGKLYDMSMLSKLNEAREQVELLHQEREQAPYGTDANQGFSISIGEHFRNRLSKISDGVRVCDYGTVISCADGIVHVDGLFSSRYGELLEFENNAYGMALELSSTGLGAVLFSGANEVYAGSIVRGTGRVMDIGVGNELLGRVVDPLGRPLDGYPLTTKLTRPLESPAPSIMERSPVEQPLQTGILSIDSMIPIGKGQRELIIGDRQMGKTAIALSAMLNQSAKGTICIYCSIGQKASLVAQLAKLLTDSGVMHNCIIVAATAGDSPAMQYVSPYAGCAIGEYFMYSGRDVLIVYDDLSKHATSYRTMSLLLKRPPGREAYPGDVFYLHSRLLERAAKLSKELGGGSMTALPIVETMSGDISAYVPTNVISITDGQIYLESELFHAGIRPAINVGLSVSRVGRAAQPRAMRLVSSQLRLNLAQYRELSVFAQFDSDIDANTRRLLDRGKRLTELLKQDQSTVHSLSEQVAILLAYQKGLFDEIPIEGIIRRRKDFCAFLFETHGELMLAIDRTEQLTSEDKNAIVNAITQFSALCALAQQSALTQATDLQSSTEAQRQTAQPLANQATGGHGGGR